jgi:hypothetical protein
MAQGLYLETFQILLVTKEALIQMVFMVVVLVAMGA